MKSHTALQGKGFFIEHLPACEAGDPAAILAAARAAGLSHVIVKIADGPDPVGLDLSTGADSSAPIIKSLRGGGMAVWGWQPVYGDDPEGEAQAAVERAQTLGLDGYVVYAWSGYEQPGREESARRFMAAVRDGLKLPIALSSHRFPAFHPDLPWAAFLEGCDFHMPQVFWELAHDPGGQLRESKRQCDALPNARPYLATGPAYGPAGSWAPTLTEMTEFLSTARALQIEAVNFFAWEACRADLPGLWEAIAAFHWPASVHAAGSSGRTPAPAASRRAASAAAGTSAPGAAAPGRPNTEAARPVLPAEPDGFTQKFLAALNSRQPGLAANLYARDAVRVRADRTLHGLVSIQADYAAFFASLPAQAVFTLDKVGIQGQTRYLSWRVGPLTGLTTLVVEGGEIVQDYTLLE